jgi:TetR/AcrR family transcriptional repressor of nem operon
MPRTPNPEIRSRLLSAGLDIIHAQGFHGCGVQDITSAAGIPKGSFYNYFPTKDAFAVEVLEEYWSALEDAHAPILRNPRVAPTARIAAYFQALSQAHRQHDFVLGCLIGALALELSSNSADIRAKVHQLLDRWALPLSDCLREAQAGGALSPEPDANELAAVLIEAWEGAALRGKVMRDERPYRRFETVLLPALLRPAASPT